MASTASVSSDMISRDVKGALQCDIAAKPNMTQALPCNVPLTEALSCNVAPSAQALPSISTTEALHQLRAIPKTENLLQNAFLAPSTDGAPVLPQPMENLHVTLPPPFLTKIYDMIEDEATNSTVSWSSGNNSFVVWNLSEFSQRLLPRYFKHNNFSSFVRQLNTYGFRKVNSDCWEFAHEAFLRGQKHLLKDIHRRRSVCMQAAQKNQPQQQKLDKAVVPTLTEPCVEVGTLGVEAEIERLKRDKCALAAEVVRLRQLQQSAERETRAMAQRVQVAERRQEQMMNFLAKAIQSPAFLAQLVQQSEKLQLGHDGRKKSRLPSGTEEPEVLVGAERQQLLSETGMSSREESPSLRALLVENASKGQSMMFSGITAHTQFAIEDRNTISLDFDSATTTGQTCSLEGGSDDLDLDFDLQDFIEEIVPAGENSPLEDATISDTFWGDFGDKVQEKGEHSGSNIANAADAHVVKRVASGTGLHSDMVFALVYAII